MRAEESSAEHEDRWVLGLRGLRVTEARYDRRLVLVLGAGWEVALGGAVRRSLGGVHLGRVVPLAPESLVGATVLSAVAFKSGTLRLVLDTGQHLTCPSAPDTEAWQVTGPAGRRFAALPGGGLSVRSGPGTSAS